MSDKVKLIIEIPKYYLEHPQDYTCLAECVRRGTPLPKEHGWIPVSERLPEDDGLYLVYTEEQPFVCPFEDGEFFIDEVIAWMPLPTPYEPQEGANE